MIHSTKMMKNSTLQLQHAVTNLLFPLPGMQYPWAQKIRRLLRDLKEATGRNEKLSLELPQTHLKKILGSKHFLESFFLLNINCLGIVGSYCSINICINYYLCIHFDIYVSEVCLNHVSMFALLNRKKAC